MTQLTPAVRRERARLDRATARWRDATAAGLKLVWAIDEASPPDASDFVRDLTRSMDGDLLLAQQVFDWMRTRGWLVYDLETGTVRRGAQIPEA